MISEIARPAGIHVSQLFRWRKELCRTEEPRSETAPLSLEAETICAAYCATY
ncbi:transposase [Agrobacterium tumefaciens]|uniref:transposase n=1 Tax=Agrobacterium tumefaciens TaxID=358 RepID=UPI0015739AE7|nr:transposase [Agrobacterium tumefaciens]NTC46878.1 transposase [Agrobacterium tumefaciens]